MNAPPQPGTRLGVNLPIDLVKRRWRALPQTAPGECVYAIGDVHGCLPLMLRMLDLIARDWTRFRQERRVRVIVLGDFIDRGPATRELLQQLMDAEKSYVEIEVLLGNHEAMLLDSIAGNPAAQRSWLAFGGLETLASYGLAHPDEAQFGGAFGRQLYRALGSGVVEWLEERPLFRRSGDFFFCHAGVRPGVRLNRQSRDDLLWIREPFLGSRIYHGAVVVHGHTIVPAADVRSNRIALDTGAYQSGTLSAICLDGSDARLLVASAEDNDCPTQLLHRGKFC